MVMYRLNLGQTKRKREFTELERKDGAIIWYFVILFLFIYLYIQLGGTDLELDCVRDNANLDHYDNYYYYLLI